MATATVDLNTFLSELTAEQNRIIQRLRGIVRKASPAAEETILWRSLWYHRPALGGRIKGAVCVITPRGAGVQLGFIHGAMLHDPRKLLIGRGKAKRVVTISSAEEIREAPLASLIKAASNYDPANSKHGAIEKRPAACAAGAEAGGLRG